MSEDNTKRFDMEAFLNGEKERLLLCPICKRPGGIEKIRIITDNDPRDLRCLDCGKTWASRYLEAFWDGYAQHVSDARPMMEELMRISQEWVNANRIIWAIARSQPDGQVKIPDAIMQESGDPYAYYDAEYSAEELATRITAKIRDPESDPSLN